MINWYRIILGAKLPTLPFPPDYARDSVVTKGTLSVTPKGLAYRLGVGAANKLYSSSTHIVYIYMHFKGKSDVRQCPLYDKIEQKVSLIGHT